jgi:glucosyl-dolichyl phosphate glucuronosyltransferase
MNVLFSSEQLEDCLDCSVVICTRNRAGQLSETLASLERLDVPAGLKWEVLVVDNGSADSTADVIRSFEPVLPIRRIWQPKPGLSNARNAGVDAAKGKYLVWTDDDVHVEPRWLAAFLEAFERWPEAVVFGGKITLSLIPPSPLWLLNVLDDCQIMFAARDFGPEPVPLSLRNDKIPFGACFAVRANEQKRYRYDPSLGRAPGQNKSGEETAVIETMLRADCLGWWVPNAEVKHMIPQSRQTLEYFILYHEGCGAEWVQRQTLRPSFFGVPAIVWVKLPLLYLIFRFSYVLRRKSWAYYLGRVAWYRGALGYCIRERRSKKWLPGFDSKKWQRS